VNIDRLALRIAGTAALAVALLIYDTTSDALWQTLLLPLIMAVGALALVQNLTAVAFGTVILALIHSDLDASSWVERFAYPVVAATAGLTLLVIGITRFRRRIIATREARWAQRKREEPGASG
jgi:hypothetical protein